MSIILQCKFCDKDFSIPEYRASSAKFCSRLCKDKSLVGSGGENHPSWRGGLPKCLDCGKLLSDYNHKFCHKHARLGKRSGSWKTENLGYFGIHAWLIREFGNATHCENCGLGGEKVNGKWIIEYALLKGKEYERKRENFTMLCRGCHMEYDGIFVKGGWNKGLKQLIKV